MTKRRHRPLSARTRDAVSMVAEQLGCPPDEALRRFEERASIGQYRLHDYAKLVVDGIIRFGPDEPSRPQARSARRTSTTESSPP